MVGDDNDEAVNVCQELGVEKIPDGGPVHHLSCVSIQVLSQEKVGKGSNKKMKDEVRKKGEVRQQDEVREHKEVKEEDYLREQEEVRQQWEVRQ